LNVTGASSAAFVVVQPQDFDQFFRLDDAGLAYPLNVRFG
jgi:hypothetical protein